MRAGLVLAAGNGARMGGPKAFLEIGGQTLLEQHLRRLHEAGCREVLAVVRPEHEPRARAIADRLPFEATLVAAATESQAASLAFGLQRLVVPGGRPAVASAERLVITPVDLLPAQATTFAALARAIGGDVLAATPTHRGRGGHPVLVCATALAPYESGLTPPLRDVLASLGDRRARVDVDDPRVLGDLDIPSQLGRRDAKVPLPLRFQNMRGGVHSGRE